MNIGNSEALNKRNKSSNRWDLDEWTNIFVFYRKNEKKGNCSEESCIFQFRDLEEEKTEKTTRVSMTPAKRHTILDPVFARETPEGVEKVGEKGDAARMER